MLRDIERGVPIEAEQILGDLLRRAHDGRHDAEPGRVQGQGSANSLLRIAYAHVKSDEARRAREAGHRLSPTGG